MPSDTTPSGVDMGELRRLAEAATPGPFKAHRYEVRNEDGIFADCACPGDAALIAYLGTYALSIAAALEELAALREVITEHSVRAEVVAMREELAALRNLEAVVRTDNRIKGAWVANALAAIDAARTAKGGDE